ncbi:hypothetical protein V6N11_064001 [Hibiscus sabdariffa]|uniref:RNase H type-1 domain-containing protein n=1 Tax=Hibiscus sabdariffa TaxID=183260 RepID=A0ABR2PME2_9ROSI
MLGELFSRPLLDRESPLVTEIQAVIIDFKLKDEVRDKIVWLLDKALIWLKTVKGKKFGELDGWWEDPRTIGCGGSLASGKGELRIFSGPALHSEIVSAEFEAVIMALQIFSDADCFGHGDNTLISKSWDTQTSCCSSLVVTVY